MSTDSTASAPAEAIIGAVADPRPLIRPLPVDGDVAGRVFTTGRDAAGRFARPVFQLRLTVTGRGHWYRSDDEPDALHNDTVCRGCGHHGHFDYILDYKPCPRPATAQDIASALLADYPRPAPVAPRALYAGVAA